MSPANGQLAERVRQAGVVGAGGAGFPTHVKVQASVDTYICNAAECEPLLCKDQELMKLHAEEMVHGMRLAMAATGASRGVIAIKEKYKQAIAELKKHISTDIDFYYYGAFYPAGDEYIIVYDVTRTLIPPGGIPLDVGCAVNNVETLINISRADRGIPVTHTALTVAGAVANPISAVVPIGITAREVLALAGGSLIDEPALLDGGAMMGKVVFDLDKPVTKTSGGYIVLPRDHHIIRRKTAPMEVKVTISKSACDQCMYCTEFCPRYLLGYAIEPHKVMRSVGFEGDKEEGWAELGIQCCECSICDLYACPEDLPPKDMCVRSKQIWRAKPIKPELLPNQGVHPMRDARRIPMSRLIQRLNLTDWDVHAPMHTDIIVPSKVRLMLRQHIGSPSQPIVTVGDRVTQGQLVAAIPDGQLGSNIHTSIQGRVSAIDGDAVTVEAA